MTKKLFLAIALLFPSSLAIAGAWTQEKGKWQLITTAHIYQAAYYFDANGKKQPQAAFFKQELSQYVEYGLRDNLTLGGQTSVARAFQQNASTTQNSGWNVSDSEFFARYRAWQTPDNVFSLQPSIIIPSFDSKSARPKIGSDDFSFSLRGNAGHHFSLWGKMHYANASLGYVHRLGTPNDQLKIDMTLGMNITNNWQLMPQAFATRAVGSPKMNGFTQSSADDYDLTKLQLSVLYRVTENRTLQLGAYKNLAGKNTGNGQGVLFAYWASF